MNIQWVDGIPNFYSRNGVKPFVIVNHISAGTLGSMTNWFKNPKAQASSHFGVGRDGTILQYVKLENGAWTQGVTMDVISNSKTPVIKEMKMNPNYYCVGIEHEGYIQGHLDEKGEVITENFGLDGALTEAQFNASCWLHRYIMDYLNNAYGVNMSLGEYNVIGHFQIDPVRKPNCPGPNFPWNRLRAELAIAQSMTLKEYEMRQHLQAERPARVKRGMDATNRIIELYTKSKDPTFAYTDVALDKMDQLYGFMKDKNLLNA